MTMSGIGRLRQVVLDCPDTMALAEFYRAILDWEILYADLEDEDGWVTIGQGTQVRLCFQRVKDHVPPTWPTAEVPQQFHIDIAVDDADEAEEQVLALGAVKTDAQPGAHENWRVYLDPAGHPFCLTTP
jgi:catechol 2,3-dioxygenase-like lactoylglutathione lyase family enzyme